MFKFRLLSSNRLLSVNILFNATAKTASSAKKNKMENVIFRDWINNPEYENYQRKREETLITVMSYNILAQDLIDQHPYLYYRHQKEDLNYDKRSKLLFREMRHIKPDILCLQEMQENHLNDFKVQCNTIDLQEVIFKKRTDPHQTDGCAIFFNSTLMELVEKEEKVEFHQPNIDVLNRTNVAIIAKFRLKKYPNSILVVATTHLLYNPRRQDVRLAQLQVLLAEIDRIAYRGLNESKQPQYEPIILTGDFNFQPHTAHYAFLLNGILRYKNLTKRLECNNVYEPRFGNRLLPIDLGITDNCQHYQSVVFNDRSTKTLHNSENQENFVAPTVDELRNSYLPFETGTIRHQLNFSSVYNSNASVSTFQNQWVLVDYIFYRRELNQMTNKFEEKNLKLLARFELPSFQHCCHYLQYGGIPNIWQGSDHFSLAAKFLLSPTSAIQHT